MRDTRVPGLRRATAWVRATDTSKEHVQGEGATVARNDNDLRGQILELLLDKVSEDPFPSVTMLDMIEKLAQDDELEPYTEALMDKVRQDRFPSMDHLRRLQGLV